MAPQLTVIMMAKLSLPILLFAISFN